MKKEATYRRSLSDSLTLSDTITISSNGFRRPLNPPRWFIRDMLISRMLGPKREDAERALEEFLQLLRLPVRP